MSSVLETHRKAMEWADKGQLLRDRGDDSGAREAFHRAMKLERETAFAAGDTEPDRSVLLRSAGSLALDCNELRAAEQLFAMGLAGDPPDEIAEEIRDLLEQVHFRRHLDSRGMTLEPNEGQGGVVPQVDVTGTLHYADAIGSGRGTIKLEEKGGSVHEISVPEGMMSDIVRPLWDDVVRVTGVRRGRRIELKDIVRAED